MISFKEMKIQKSFIIFWVSVCVILAGAITINSYNVNSDVRSTSTVVADSRLPLQIAESQIEILKTSQSPDIETFYLENLNNLVVLPNLSFYEKAIKSKQMANTKIPIAIESRKKMFEAKFSLETSYHQISGSLEKLNLSKDQDIADISKQLEHATKSINNLYLTSFLKGENSINEYKEDITNIVNEAQADLQSWQSNSQELINLSQEWNDYIDKSYTFLLLEIQNDKNIKSATNALLALRINIDNGYKSHLDYANQTSLSFVGLMIILLIGLTASVFIGFKNRHFSAMISKNSGDMHRSELQNIMDEISQLNNYINNSWALTSNEIQVINDAIESASDLNERLNLVKQKVTNNTNYIKLEQDDLAKKLKALKLQTADKGISNELSKFINELELSTKSAFNSGLDSLKSIEKLSDSEQELLSELKAMNRILNTLRKESISMQNGAHELEISKELLSSV